MTVATSKESLREGEVTSYIIQHPVNNTCISGNGNQLTASI